MSKSMDRRLKIQRAATNQDREPNFRAKGELFLVYCYACNRENYAPNVPRGVCSWCGWKEDVK